MRRTMLKVLAISAVLSVTLLAGISQDAFAGEGYRGGYRRGNPPPRVYYSHRPAYDAYWHRSARWHHPKYDRYCQVTRDDYRRRDDFRRGDDSRRRDEGIKVGGRIVIGF